MEIFNVDVFLGKPFAPVLIWVYWFFCLEVSFVGGSTNLKTIVMKVSLDKYGYGLMFLKLHI